MVLGKGGADRIGEQSQDFGQQQHAGFDQCLSGRLRRTWYRLGGSASGLEGFNAFFGRLCAGL